MRKKHWIALIISMLLLSGCVFKVNEIFQTGTTKNTSKLTLIQAIKHAYPTAKKWNEAALLIDVTSIDGNQGVAKLDGEKWVLGYNFWNTEYK